MSDSKGKNPEDSVNESLTQEEFNELYGEDDNEEVFVDINDLIESGTKFFALQQYDMAIDRYSNALNILVNQYGEFSPNCAQVYYLYGQTLLQKAIRQSDVFGEKMGENVQVQEKSNDIIPKKSMNRFSFQGDEEDEEENEEQEEDLFESAWQMLDLCRIIYEKDTTVEGQKKLGDVIKTLGDVHLEDGNYLEAAKYYEDGLEILEKVLEPDNRTLAETHYKLALALECNEEGEKAVTHIKKAILVFKKKLESLEKMNSDNGKGKKAADTETINAQEEIEGIKELLVDMKKKLAELKGSLKKNLDVKQMLSNSFKQSTNVNTSQPTQINDLSSLIKKRKVDDTKENKEKSDDKKEVKEPEVKKVKVNEESKEEKGKEAL
ncbi:hypothetical protein BCR36DRAFT_581635 [Piromyces finnis]|uniref:Tetratricopeptide SHNi-TPR domain-containing protein n=1 Tax=Piromyces finnis TaxID=1754191 RepID=A0A1Y1VF65_9FUNG|nr:hypothetical protein BCR36DRAFT_581635 [Piromyces finnis]|eukprot:ORX54743.1 hypothetical protein BCR36DRAFT_581635 [Piromyces finnis]